MSVDLAKQLGEGMSLTFDGKKIEEAAGNVLSEPLAYMDLAHRYVSDACKLHALAFGVAGSQILAGPYETSRSAQDKNLAAGSKKLHELAQGLAEVEKTFTKAEKANTIAPARKVDVKYTTPSSSGNARSEGEASIVGTELLLLPEYIGIAMALGASSALAPTALVAVAAWALVTPDDSALQKASGGWESAATQLGAIDMDTAIKPLDDGGWESENRAAFDNWIKRFKSEMSLSEKYCTTNSGALDAARRDIDKLQTTFFFIAAATLAMIIAFQACVAIPVVGAFFEVGIQVLGVTLSAETCTVVGSVVAVLGMAFGPLADMFTGSDSSFASLKVMAGGGKSFSDISVTWQHPSLS
jgi:hypothetical protein